MTEKREGYISLDSRLAAIEKDIKEHARLLSLGLGGLLLLFAEIPIGLWVLTKLIK